MYKTKLAERMIYSQSKVTVIDICYRCRTTTIRQTLSDSKVKDCECKESKFIRRVKLQRQKYTGATSSSEQLVVDKGGRIIKKAASKRRSKLTGYSATKTDLDDKCTICYCDFELEDKVYKTGCSHKFHTNCLSTWLATKQTCPQCLSPTVPVDQRNRDQPKTF